MRWLNYQMLLFSHVIHKTEYVCKDKESKGLKSVFSYS